MDDAIEEVVRYRTKDGETFLTEDSAINHITDVLCEYVGAQIMPELVNTTPEVSWHIINKIVYKTCQMLVGDLERARELRDKISSLV